LTREVLLIKKAEIDTTRADAAQQIKSSKNIQKLQKEEKMKDTFRKLFGAAGAVAMAGLLVVAAPAGAASTDERIKALEAELQQLKTDQQRVEKDQSQMQSDALAAKMKMPSIRYRNGRGLIFRAADRSWQIGVGGQFQAQMAFFPEIGDDTNSNLAQGSMFGRHMETDTYFRLMNGLYEFGLTADFSGGRQAASVKSETFRIKLGNWGPYYPNIHVLAVSPGTQSPHNRVSSTSGATLERAPAFDNRFSTFSTKGLGLNWEKVPVGSMMVNRFSFAYLSNGSMVNDDRYDWDSSDKKGVVLGITVDPFAKHKDMYTKGIRLGFTYVNSLADGARMRVRTRRPHRATLFDIRDDLGKYTYAEPWIDWNGGPFHAGYTWGRHTSENKSAEGGGDPTITTNMIEAGVYVWGPKGFLSGSRNSGWRLTYQHNRTAMDLGGFPTGSGLRKYTYVENIVMLRWYQQRNITYSLEYQNNSIDKFDPRIDRGLSSDALGFDAGGGRHQSIVLATMWQF
jgi:outer membrane murein-binding lipoprotein Lpp